MINDKWKISFVSPQEYLLPPQTATLFHLITSPVQCTGLPWDRHGYGRLHSQKVAL